MSIYKQWVEITDQQMSQEEYNKFWQDYFLKEQNNYESILESKETALKGSITELAEKFSMTTTEFAGFLDGINTSLETELDLETLEEATEIDSTIVWDKLYYNMLNAKADWLYGIEAWDGIFSEDERKAIKKQYNKDNTVIKGEKIGRNDPCPCGSGKKYKKCCLNK
jgi:uncharacterized protein YecA (UPF0149 family)